METTRQYLARRIGGAADDLAEELRRVEADLTHSSQDVTLRTLAEAKEFAETMVHLLDLATSKVRIEHTLDEEGA